MNGERQGSVRVIDSSGKCPELAITVGGGRARAVIWPGNGGEWRTFNIVELEGGSRTIDLRHSTDCVYYVRQGLGVIRDLSDGSVQSLVEGAMLHIDRGDAYRIEASEQDGLILIGGACPADEALYEHMIGGA